jgi:hypothetical protein
MVKSGETKKYKVHQIQLRLEATPGNWRPDTNFVTVGNLDTSIQIHETADAAILINPDISTREPSFGHSTFTLEELTTNEFLKNSVNLMDVASFVEFPGKDGKAWWDEEPTEGMFYHSGLSYFTRATAIKELLNA